MNGDRKKFEDVPNELLEPLVGNQHAGQIILAPGRTQSILDPMLATGGSASVAVKYLKERVIAGCSRPDAHLRWTSITGMIGTSKNSF